MRGTGNDGTFQYNWVQGSLQVNDNHCDCFQSWSVGTDGVVGDGTVYRMKLIGNTFINCLDSNLQFQAQVQGIGCFDGLFQDWVVENNVIMVNQWHGITLAGAINCLVINNTICELRKTDVGPPWIEIGTHKNGTVSTGCVVRNNLTTDIQIESGCQVTLDHNIIMKDPTAYFKDFANRDVCPKTGCAAIAGGSSLLAPAVDIYGTPRPLNGAPDIGAVQHTGATPVLAPATSAAPSREFSAQYKNGKLTLQLPAQMPDKIFCSISSLAGTVLLSRTLMPHSGMADMVIPDKSAVPRGTYVVLLRGENLDHAMTLAVR
jgi:parallel beta-helix repeat protein